MIVFRRGKNVVLSPLTKDDVPALAEWMNDYELTQFLNRRHPLTLHEEEQWLANLKSDGNNIVLGIRTHDGSLIGTIGLHNIDHINQTATTGTLIGREEYRNRGLGTEAKMLILHFAFFELNLYKVNSRVFATNLRSRAYLEKSGYVEEGVLKDEVYLGGKRIDVHLVAVFREVFIPLWEKYTAET